MRYSQRPDVAIWLHGSVPLPRMFAAGVDLRPEIASHLRDQWSGRVLGELKTSLVRPQTPILGPWRLCNVHLAAAHLPTHETISTLMDKIRHVSPVTARITTKP
jgi:hypothetical protein